jgi:O-antigen/teichoic acid export membrane protein
MRAHFTNSAYSILDYVAQPAGLLIAARILMHHLGVAQYGLWLIASAAVGAGSIISSGFGDAVIQRIASLRSVRNTGNESEQIREIVANMLTINLVLGAALAILLWWFVPMISARITHAEPVLRSACLWSLRIGAVLIVVKSIESVYISAQRAFEQYAPAVRIAIVTRLLVVTFSIALAVRGSGVLAIMLGTVVLTTLGTIVQGFALCRHVGGNVFRPAFDRDTAQGLFTLGGYTWLQAIASVLFSQADRLILGATLGASAVAYYGISLQLAQPIHGLTAAGLHVLFPHLAAHPTGNSYITLRRPIITALAINCLSAFGLTALVLLCGPRVLSLWMGQAFAEHTATLLPLIAAGFGLLALNVTAHYSLMAMGSFRFVTALNVAGGLVMLAVMAALMPTRGVHGAAIARLIYGPITCLLYLPLFHLLRTPSSVQRSIISLEQA